MGRTAPLTGAGVPLRQRRQYVGCRSREDYGQETRREYRLDRNENAVLALTASGTGGLGYGEGDESTLKLLTSWLPERRSRRARHRISVDTDMYQRGTG